MAPVHGSITHTEMQQGTFCNYLSNPHNIESSKTQPTGSLIGTYLFVKFPISSQCQSQHVRECYGMALLEGYWSTTSHSNIHE